MLLIQDLLLVSFKVSAVALTSEKDLLRGLILSRLKSTIGVFHSPSTPSSDCAPSMYFPAQDSSSIIVGNHLLETTSSLNMDSECITALEQAFTEMQAHDEAFQQKLDILVNHITSPKTLETPPIPVVHTPTPETCHTPSTRALRPALPSEFDGDRSKGVAFLYSCQTYIRLCSDAFPDDQTKIVWALSYMKTGRAALWAAQIFRWEEENPNSLKFANWNAFRDQFREEFCPVHTDQTAINRLESMAYFQNKRSVDDYLDEFLDLISEAGYTDSKTIVVKFRRGLEPRIQDSIATMTSGRPSDMEPSDWYKAAKTVNQNQATNEAFHSSYRIPSFTPSHSQPRPSAPGIIRPYIHAHTNPSPGNTVPMDIDAAQRKAALPIMCYHCGKPGHKSSECNLRFDICALSVDELQTYLEDRLAGLDAVTEKTEEKEVAEKSEQDFAPHNEGTACPRCRLITVLMS